ncbi:MAG TPA: hypothetical protein VH481_04165 [Nitrososphaeraceae archaeon]
MKSRIRESKLGRGSSRSSNNNYDAGKSVRLDRIQNKFSCYAAGNRVKTV